jgi:hypothetical protein
MKFLKLFVFGLVLFLASATQAQVSVHLNIGTPPQWGPAGYSNVRYYYLPYVEAYYDVQTSMFIYFEGRSWVRRSYLPSRYKNYDLYDGYKVVMKDYHGNAPYYKHREYRTLYPKRFRGPSQRTIGERPRRGNENQRSYQQSNQVNRGRGSVIDKNDRRGDSNYNRRGDEKSNVKLDNDKKEKNDRGRGNDKANRK